MAKQSPAVVGPGRSLLGDWGLGRWAAGTVIGVAVGFGFAALLPRPTPPASERCAITVYVTGDRLHANVIVPVHSSLVDWQQLLPLDRLAQPSQGRPLADYAYLSVGWGDREFFLNTPRLQDLNWATTARALLWPTETAIQLQGYRQPPKVTPGYRVKALRLGASSYRQLTQHILNSIEWDEAGQPKPLQAAVSPRNGNSPSNFYAAQGKYGFWHTCNDWLAAGLRSAGLRTPVWSGLADSLFRQLESNCLD